MDKKFDPLKIENQICFPLYVASKEVVRAYAPFLEELDLTFTQYIAMSMLWEHKKMSVKELGEKLFLDSGTLTPVLKTLEKKGYVTRKRSYVDERVLVVELTEQGQNLKKEAIFIPGKVASLLSLTFADALALNKLLDKSNNFYTTQFVLGNHRAPGRIETILRNIPTDEKYHWYRIPGKIELRSNPYFWGHAWAIQARTAHWYFLTDGNPLDNTWEQVWFHAKFTGPAYVPGSTRDNAIYIDMAVITRGEKEEQFIKANVNAEFADKTKDNMPKNWYIAKIHKNTGTASLGEKDGKPSLIVKASPKNITDIRRPDSVICGNNAVVRMSMRASGEAAVYAALYLYSKDKFLGTYTVRIPTSGNEEEAIFDIGRLHKDAIRFVPCIRIGTSDKTVEIDKFDVSYAPDFNIQKTETK